MSQSKSDEKKRPYSTPALVKVDLVVEEAVLISCKRGGLGGTGAQSCPKGNSCTANKGS